MIHELKIKPKFFQDIINGIKNFEIRKNDRMFRVGDILVLSEFDYRDNTYTGNQIKVKVDNILTHDDVHVITKNYFETMMKYYISISKICDDFNNNETECTKCPVWSCNDGCFFIDSYIANGIVENLGIQHHLPIPRDYKYKNKFLCKCRDYKELIGDTNE